MNVSLDARRLGLFDIFAEATPGQVNLIRLHAGQRCGWHRHQRQTDRYFCVAGVVTVGVIDPQEVCTWATLNAYWPQVILVPPNHWHGYTPVGSEATLLQYLDCKYDSTDEERHPESERLWTSP